MPSSRAVVYAIAIVATAIVLIAPAEVEGVCSLPGIANGITFISANQDYGGNDLGSTTTAAYTTNALVCNDWCKATYPSTAKFIGLQQGAQCWCKTAASTISGTNQRRTGGIGTANTVTNIPTGSVANVLCDSGYTATGSATRTCQSSGSFDGTVNVCTKMCSLSYINGPTTGLIMANGYDWSGSDLAQTSVPNRDPLMCISYCDATTASATTWEIQGTTCYCKGSATLTQIPTAATNNMGGPLNGNTLTQIWGATVISNTCPPGMYKYPYAGVTTTCSNGAYSTSSFVCKSSCTLTYQNSQTTGLMYLAGWDYWGNDLGNSPDGGCYTPECCRSYCVTNYPTAKLWQYASTYGKCWCKSSVQPSPVSLSYMVSGPMSGYTLTGVPHGESINTACFPSTTLSGSQSCSDGTLTGTLGCTLNPCNITYSYTPGTGLQYLQGYNIGGTDLASSATGLSNALLCYKFCVTTYTASGFKYWQWDASTGTTTCKCKSSIGSSLTAATSVFAGASLPIYLISNIPSSVESVKAMTCDSGYTSTGAASHVCTTGAWVGGTFTCTDINECATLNGGCDSRSTCINIPGSRNCSACQTGYSSVGQTGANTCIQQCASNPCGANGACTTNYVYGYYNCTCNSGWSGRLCDQNINDCSSAPCRNGATCNDLVNGYTCTCAAGYSGFFCQTNINECASNPCTRGGTCVDGANGFSCTCPAGYSGLLCQTEINECSSTPCQNGGTCTDQVTQFVCACRPGYSGAFCQTNVNECASQPCRNGGTCTDGVASFTCTCASGYSGVLCQTDVNECSSVPCRNGGTCADGVDSFTCTCVGGYSGVLCQTNVNECSSDPCRNGGTCVDGVNSFSCICVSGYSGLLCQTNVNECSSVPCANGGTCTDQVNSYRCTCVAGFSGANCQTDINECASNPCFYGAKNCTDEINRFTCHCLPGYSGIYCQTDINECASNPCVYGYCTDLKNGFNCTCNAGITGTTCATDINECATANGGCNPNSVCTNVLATYSCTPYLIPGTLYSPDYSSAATAGVNVTLGSTGSGYRLRFNISVFAVKTLADTSLDVAVTLGTFDDPIQFPCGELTYRAGSPINYAAECRLPAAGGRDLFLFTSQSNEAVTSHSYQTVSYPVPTITSNTLHRNQTGYASTVTTELVVDTSDAVAVQFYGTNFYGPAMTVTYGTSLGAYENYTCDVVLGQTTGSVLTCLTTAGSQGISHIFKVDVNGQVAIGADRLTFPDTPAVMSVSGCTPASPPSACDTGMTCDCPTEGGVTITVSGKNFVQTGIQVTVNGLACTTPVVSDASGVELTCVLPASAGSGIPVIVYSSGHASVAANLVSYALPTFTGLTSSDCVQASALRVKDCPNAGGSILTVTGMNFGPPGAVILLGSHLCESATADPDIPHRQYTCIAQSGYGTGLAVLMLQSGGSFGVGVAPSVDYYQCPAGTYRNNLDCPTCPDGQYSEILDAQSCTACDAGKFSDSPPIGCTMCAEGTVSTGGLKSCTPCLPGTYMSLRGKVSCTSCESGKYQNGTAATNCDPCPATTQQPALGQSTCGPCPIGTASSGTAVGTCGSCGAGYFSNETGLATCYACPIGFYQPSSGASACVSCDPGYFTNQPASNTQTACGQGLYAPAANATACLACAGGRKQVNTGQSSCAVCDAGTYSQPPVLPLTLNINCLSCPKGTYSAARKTTCSQCLAGSYQPLPGQAACLPTNPGEYTDSMGQFATRLCDAGYFIDVQNATRCSLCPGGTYAATAGASTCTYCAGGQFTLQPDGFSINSNYQTCPAGTFSLANSTTCDKCEAGMYSAAGSSACSECAPGKFSAGNVAACSDCPRGTYSTSNKTITCTNCPGGLYNSDVGQTECAECSAGTFSPQPGTAGATANKECTRCLPGTYSSGASSFCAPCTAGKYSGLEASVCTPCELGRYSSIDRADTCTDCSSGLYANLTGLSTCGVCGAGFAQPTQKATSCVLCTPGTYTRTPIGSSYNTRCLSAPQGAYTTANGATDYTLCAPGMYQNSAGSTFCYACGNGTYSSEPGFSTSPCTLCAAGRFNPTTGQSACAECPAGRSQSAAGTTECIECDAGRSASGTGNKDCTDCRSGYYTNLTEQTECTSCYAPYVTGVRLKATSCSVKCSGTLYQQDNGQSACSECATQSYWSGSVCEDCPIGTNCAPLLGNTGISGTNGYFVYQNERGQLLSLTCASCVACPTSEGANGTVLTAASISTSTGQPVYSCCGANYAPAASNPMCGACATGYHNSGSECILCDEVNYGYVVAILLVSWGYITMFHIIGQASSADSRIFLNYVQFVYLFLSAQSGSLTNWLALFNFNMFQASGSNCIAPMTDLERLSTGLFVPLVGLGFLALNIVLHYVLFRCCGWRNQMCCLPAIMNLKPQTDFHIIARSYRRTALGFFASSYPSICQTVFTFFSCVTYGSEEYIITYPSVSCTSDPQYLKVYPFFVFLMIAVVATPIVVYYRLYVLHKAGKLDDRSERDEVVVYGILCETYKPQLFGWECFVLIRRMIVAAVLLAPQFNTDTASKFTWLCLSMVIFLSVHFYKKPYRLDLDNQMEALGELCLIVLTLFLVSAPAPLTILYASALTAMCLFVAFVFLMRILILRVDQSMVVLRRMSIPMQEGCPCIQRYCNFWCCCITDEELREHRKQIKLARTASGRSAGGELPAPPGALLSLANPGGAGGGFKPLVVQPVPSIHSAVIATAHPDDAVPSAAAEQAGLERKRSHSSKRASAREVELTAPRRAESGDSPASAAAGTGVSRLQSRAGEAVTTLAIPGGSNTTVTGADGSSSPIPPPPPGAIPITPLPDLPRVANSIPSPAPLPPPPNDSPAVLAAAQATATAHATTVAAAAVALASVAAAHAPHIDTHTHAAPHHLVHSMPHGTTQHELAEKEAIIHAQVDSTLSAAQAMVAALTHHHGPINPHNAHRETHAPAATASAAAGGGNTDATITVLPTPGVTHPPAPAWKS